MMGVGVVLALVGIVMVMFNLMTVQPQPAPITHPEPRPSQVYYPTMMPEDIGRLESEVYKVCEQYADLDLSGMAPLCKRVGFQQ